MSCVICAKETTITCIQCQQNVICINCLIQMVRKWCPYCRMEPMKIIYNNRPLSICNNVSNLNDDIGYLLFREFIKSEKYPILNVKNKSSAYIDYIKWTDVDAPVMIGADYFTRPFIVIKCKIIDENCDDKLMQVFFQRHSDRDTHWMGCRLKDTTNIIKTIGGITSSQFILLYLLLNNYEMVLEPEYRPNKKLMNATIKLISL